MLRNGKNTTAVSTPPHSRSVGSLKRSSPRIGAGPAPLRRPRVKPNSLSDFELLHVDGPESSVRFNFPDIETRQGPAVRTKRPGIGYPDRTIASDVHVEIDHGTRIGIVGDNGQGKTTFLRTVCGSIEPIAGDVIWGFGCQVGIYAQHVYTSLPEQKTVMEYLEYQAVPSTITQQIKDVAGSFLFSGDIGGKADPGTEWR